MPIVPTSGSIRATDINLARGSNSSAFVSLSHVRSGVFPGINRSGTTVSFSDLRGKMYVVSAPTANLVGQYRASAYPGSGGTWTNAVNTSETITPYVSGVSGSSQPINYVNAGSGSYFAIPYHTDGYAYQIFAPLYFFSSPRTVLTVGIMVMIDGKSGTKASFNADMIYDSDWTDKQGAQYPSSCLQYLNGTISTIGRNSGGGFETYDTGFAPTFGTWFSALVNYNFNTGRCIVWINGARRVDRSPGNNRTDQATAFRIGKDIYGGGFDMYGKIASVLMYNSEITSDTTAKQIHNYFATDSGGLMSTVA